MKQETPTKTQGRPSFSRLKLTLSNKSPGDSPRTASTAHVDGGTSSSSPSPSPSPSLSPASARKAVGGGRPVPPQLGNGQTSSKRSLALNKPKSRDGVVAAPQKGLWRPPVEQFACPRRRTEPQSERRKIGDDSHSKSDEKKNELLLLQEKLDLNDTLIKDLQAEVLVLKTNLDKAQSLNVDLRFQNQKLIQDLAAAQANIAALTARDQRDLVADYQSPKFKDIQRLIANKLEKPKVEKEANNDTETVTTAGLIQSTSKVAVVQAEIPPHTCPPPPPPPPPLHPIARAGNTKKASSLVDFYHPLTKREGKKQSIGPGNHNMPAVTSAHSCLVGEIQNRSAHLLAIKADIETKGDFINGLIQKVLTAAYTDMEDVLNFVDWLDRELLLLADERAVLKHFKWPERKADAMREAAIEYRCLKLLESEVSCYEDNANIVCGAALKKMGSLQDRSERGIQRLIKLRDSVMFSYKDLKIPTDWMLDSGIVSKIKLAAMKLAKMYMNRVMMELGSFHNSEKESVQEALLLQGVHFAYRAHQFAGGFDPETLCAFKEIKQRLPGHLVVSGPLLDGIPSLKNLDQVGGVL
ncbi:uncharacterized protein LOC131151654 isoform X3 [Malania oleifera]|uniref:uncharacterized protein LOC131151654 isoform X3 n=1 Tax=Malania oleifera TaxID=397392 RepID=UPI0025AE8D33|nr:uncharacterized protein LOC131151654 isoform X3 [Malania oleifera]